MTDDIALGRALATAKGLADKGILTEREAQALVLVTGLGLPAADAADVMDVSKSRVYNARQNAEDRLERAEWTLAMRDELGDDLDIQPEQCARCGDGLTEWTVVGGCILCEQCTDVEF